MKTTLKRGLLAALVATSLASSTFADSNGTKGSILNTTGSQSLTGGPFSHGAGVGSGDNSTSNFVVTDSFNANRLIIDGEIVGNISVGGFYVFGDADIRVTSPSATTLNWNNPLGFEPDSTTSPTAYSEMLDFSPTSVNGTWSFEFIDENNDGAGADSTSSNVSFELQNVEADQDENGVFSLGSFAGTDSRSSVGEFLVGNIFDQYSVSFSQAGVLDFETVSDPSGLAGSDVDTEIAIFDSTGTQIDYDDQDGAGDFSLISNLSIAAGDYTLVVAGFGSNIDAAGSTDLSGVTGGTRLGDYGLNVSFVAAIPEPSSMVLLGLAGIGMGLVRRRN